MLCHVKTIVAIWQPGNQLQYNFSNEFEFSAENLDTCVS